MALDRYNSIAYKLKDDARKSVGIYHWKGGEVNSGQIIVETGQECTDIDAKGVAPNGTSLLVESVAMERDSFRGSLMVVSVACATEVTDADDIEEEEVDEGDWGGIYMTRLSAPPKKTPNPRLDPKYNPS